jgi:hypothetical protein
MACIVKLKVHFKTASATFAGTDAAVYLVFCGAHDHRVYRLPTRKPELETGKLDIYELDVPSGPDLGQVSAVLLVNGMSGPNPAWRLLWTQIQAVDDAGHSWELVDAMVERWLDTKEGRAPVFALPLKRPFVELGVKDVVGSTTGSLALVP